MAIKEEKPLTMSEVVSIIRDTEKTKIVKEFIKQFDVIDLEKAMELKEKLTNLELLKLKEQHIIKIVDFMPKEATELNKVLSDVNLDADEINKVLEVTRKY